MATKQEKMEAFGQLLDILDELRVKCPWDRKQTNESLRTNTIEETYELCDAIMKDDNNNIKKELGDLLLHIVFYAKIGEEKAAFDIKDVCDSLCQKLIYRHPHVFGNAQAETAGKVEQSWEQLKLKEKGGNKTVLEGVPTSLPSVVKAGAAVAPVTDWNYYDTVYGERFMRTPKENAEGYKASSAFTRANNLHGNLLLVHGMADDNVHFQNCAEYAEHLVQLGKQFDMQVYTNRNHSIFGGNTRLHLYTKLTNFFNRELKK